MKNKLLSRALEEEYKNSIGDDERSNCSDLDRGRDSKTIKVSQAESAAKENGLFRVLSVQRTSLDVAMSNVGPMFPGALAAYPQTLKVEKSSEMRCNAMLFI